MRSIVISVIKLLINVDRCHWYQTIECIARPYMPFSGLMPDVNPFSDEKNVQTIGQLPADASGGHGRPRVGILLLGLLQQSSVDSPKTVMPVYV